MYTNHVETYKDVISAGLAKVTDDVMKVKDFGEHPVQSIEFLPEAFDALVAKVGKPGIVKMVQDTVEARARISARQQIIYGASAEDRQLAKMIKDAGVLFTTKFCKKNNRTEESLTADEKATIEARAKKAVEAQLADEE
jgi:hypothetical protein